MINVTSEGLTLTQNFRINVQSVNDGPELYVLEAPTLALEKTDILFSVRYFDVDESDGPLVAVEIDIDSYEMELISGDIHAEGGIYERKFQLPAGKYEYYFIGDDKTMSPEQVRVNRSGSYTLMVIKYSETGDDTDGDSIPDAWELRYGLDPLDPTDAAIDGDNDTYTNLQEYLGADGKPGGGDSSDPKDAFDLPIDDSLDEDKISDEKESLSFLSVLLLLS
jgi:hypothetical protein